MMMPETKLAHLSVSTFAKYFKKLKVFWTDMLRADRIDMLRCDWDSNILEKKPIANNKHKITKFLNRGILFISTNCQFVFNHRIIYRTCDLTLKSITKYNCERSV